MTGRVFFSRASQALRTQPPLPVLETAALASQRTSTRVAQSHFSSFSFAQRSSPSISSVQLTPKLHFPFSLFRRSITSRAWTPPSLSTQVCKYTPIHLPFSMESLETSPLRSKRLLHTQSVRHQIEKNAYVDKTRFIQRLIQEGTKHSSLYLPQGFGTSLFLNTMKEILQGNKELFKGCHIYDSQYSWKQYPVFHLDFSELPTRSHEQFEESLKRKLQSIALEQGISISDFSFGFCLEDIIKAMAANNNRVVVLTDNCYAPVIDNLNQPVVAKKNYDSICHFLNIIKGMCGYTHLTVATGQSQFAYLGLSSGPDYFKDLTMDPQYAGMVGFTEDEIQQSFASELQAIATQRSLLKEDLLAEMREWHYGYRFSESDVTVYNPQAILEFLRRGESGSSSYTTGTTPFLMQRLKTCHNPQSVLDRLSAQESYLITLGDASHLEEMRLYSLMFSSGYLTVTGHTPSPYSYYDLGFANEAVKQGFLNSVIEDIAELSIPQVTQGRDAIQSSLKQHNMGEFIPLMNGYFSQIPSSLFKDTLSSLPQLIFFAILYQSQNQGKRRIPVHHHCSTHIMELPHTNYVLRIGNSEAPAYDKTHAQEGKTLAVVHLQFDSKAHQFSEWKGTLFSTSGQTLQQL